VWYYKNKYAKGYQVPKGFALYHGYKEKSGFVYTERISHDQLVFINNNKKQLGIKSDFLLLTTKPMHKPINFPLIRINEANQEFSVARFSQVMLWRLFVCLFEWLEEGEATPSP